MFFNNQISFNNPVTPTMIGIIDVHHQIFFYLIIIFFVVFWLFSYSIYNSILREYKIKNKKKFIESAKQFEHCFALETLWTIIPAYVLYTIALPSLALLYSMDEVSVPAVTLKVVGHQWYWSYEYPDNYNNNYNYLTFDSNLIKYEDLENKNAYLLEVDNHVYLPISCPIKALITSIDVIHSWAIPSFGVKTDACPGRLNQVVFTILKEGVYYGQCSELCGVGHGFMPIVIEAVTLDKYLFWVKSVYK